MFFFWVIALLLGVAFLDHNQDDREMWVFQNTLFKVMYNQCNCALILFLTMKKKGSISGGLVSAGQNSDPDDKKERKSFLMLSKKKFLFLVDWFQPVRILIRMTRRKENPF